MTWEHGSHNGYNNHGCRCAACKAAGSAYNASRRQYRREWEWRTGRSRPKAVYLAENGMAEGGTHGRIATYNAGCRCAGCREAGRVAKARQRAKNRATA